MSYTTKLSPFALAIVALVAVAASSAHGGIVSSSSFSIGYGYTGTWNTTETTGFNTATTLGDFSFTPAVVGTGSSGAGPIFSSRILADGLGGPSFGSQSAESTDFAVTLSGAYSGTIPPNALNPEIRINVDSIRVWVTNRAAGGPGNPGIAFIETTPGHLAASTTMTGIPTEGSANQLLQAAFFKQLIWNPADYFTPGFTFDRMFELDNNVAIRYAIDGFEILGTIDVSFVIVPEPTTFVLLGLGIAALAGVNRRSRTRRGQIAASTDTPANC